MRSTVPTASTGVNGVRLPKRRSARRSTPVRAERRHEQGPHAAFVQLSSLGTASVADRVAADRQGERAGRSIMG
ncbi:MAG: hypothetical protein ABSC06_37330 [Rhodopila sp.]